MKTRCATGFGIVCLALSGLCAPDPAVAAEAPKTVVEVKPAVGEPILITLCYHNVPAAVMNDPYGVDVKSFAEQLEYLKTHGYAFVSAGQVRDTALGKARLPDKSAMISFDDAYTSFPSNVLPLLELYECPVLLAVCVSWTEEGGPKDLPAPLMSWEQIRSAATNPLVTLASHSYDLHKAVQYNPQGNTAHAATSRIFFPERKTYENEAQYRIRVGEDLRRSRDIMRERTGYTPDIIVWPYGENNALSTEEAQKAGFTGGFLLRNHRSRISNAMQVDRWVVMNNPSVTDFIEDLKVREKHGEYPPAAMRAIQVDLDLVFDPLPEQMERNLDRLLERIAAIRPNTVMLQAFADPDGDGTVDAVYFPNRVLPMRADLLNRVCNQLYIRGFNVYVWMPTLAVELPDKKRTESLRVQEYKVLGARPSTSWYRRLSPFSQDTEQVMTMLYSDLAAYVRFHGVLFQDDAYLTDSEDFHPAAIAYGLQHLGYSVRNPADLSEKQMAEWTTLKTSRLTELTTVLANAVRRYRPDTKFIRTLYASVLENPHAVEWMAQNFGMALSSYDYVAVMAYPEMEQRLLVDSWLQTLAASALRFEGGAERSLFKLQSFDWKGERWIPEDVLLGRARLLMASGIRNLAYYPDDYTIDRPRQSLIREEFSTETFLFPKPRNAPARGY